MNLKSNATEVLRLGESCQGWEARFRSQAQEMRNGLAQLEGIAQQLRNFERKIARQKDETLMEGIYQMQGVTNQVKNLEHKVVQQQENNPQLEKMAQQLKNLERKVAQLKYDKVFALHNA